ncbi:MULTISPECIES: hypothetical protein [Gemella]|uniref:hypothetical protein n=1 Tax=Gemella TaxID=1378 RepID=UPI000767F237|nr:MULTISPECIES: hypothetical protein [Gemella]AME09997.1 hypothetical protein AXE85_07485 [Gemella sp. oral taxon 928]
MTTLKRNLLISTGIYMLFYLGPILVNPFAILNIAEAFAVALLVYGGFYLSYIFLYTNKSKLDERTKNTIITIIIMTLALIVYYNPFTFPAMFNIIINKYLAIFLLVGLLVVLLLVAQRVKSVYILAILFAPSIIQGVLMRSSNRAMLFYLNNPNFTLYCIVVLFAVYYIYYNRRR